MDPITKENRINSMSWWNLLTDLGKKMAVGRSSSLQFRDYDSLTGSEIETVWMSCGLPSHSSDMRTMMGTALIGRAVEIDGYMGAKSTFSTIVSTTDHYFKVDGSNDLYRRDSGKLRGDGKAWRPCYARLVSPEEVNKELTRRRELKRINATKATIIQELNSGRPTLEQLEAACVALGLVRL